MFEVAIYTDTRASEAIDGIDGFNFQAASSGITAADREVIRDRLLHRVASGWSAEHDPLSHPPTFAYLKCAGRHYLARGISTGLTGNGRPGNFITQALVTPDPDDFGSLRPAQLFGAERWQLSKAHSQRLERWAGPLEVHPDFSVEALSRMVRADDWAIAHLAHFITMLEELLTARPKRLILLTRDARAAERWIALGTRFLDAANAQQLSIHGMVADPMTTRGDIVAASPEFGPQPDARVPRAGVNVLDLDSRTLSPIEPSPTAQLHAHWFLTADSGAALSAMELARSWENALDQDLATQGAALVTELGTVPGVERWRTAIRVIKGLAETRLNHDLLMYGDFLLDAVVDHHPQSVDDARLAGRALITLLELGGADATDCALGVLLHTLEWIPSTPQLAVAWLHEVATSSLEPVTCWGSEEAVAQACSSATGLARVVPTDELGGLLGALKTLGLALDEPTAQELSRRFSTHWSENPELSAKASRWAHRDLFTHELTTELVRRWSAEDPSSLDLLREGAWQWLASERVDQVVAGWLRAADVSRLRPPARAERVRRLRLPTNSCLLVWGSTPLRHAAPLLRAWLTTTGTLPDSARSRLLREIHRHLDEGEQLFWLRELLLEISRHGHCGPELYRLAKQIDHADRQFRFALRTPVAGNAAMRSVAAVLPDLTPWFHDQLGELVLAADAGSRARLARADSSGVRSATHDTMLSQLTRNNTAQAINTALRLLDDPTEGVQQGARSALKEFIREPEHAGTLRDLRSQLGKAQLAALDELDDASVWRRVGRFLRDPK
ncbi:hypothetical protein HJ590_14215 [Naumannella sp. ID2617S]|nr:hypothetical protein [Naumannella sp. ID2617S]